MKKFKQFLENYEPYLDMPKGFKNPEETEPAKDEDSEDIAAEENTNEVKK